jgi:hypothetical protein
MWWSFSAGAGGGGAQHHRPPRGDHGSHRQGQADIAEHGDELGARHVLGKVAEPFQFFRSRVFQRRRDRGGGHRRLLGRHREAEQVDQDEADAVVEAEGNALGQRRQVQLRELELEHGHDGDDDAAAGRAFRHCPPVGAIFRDVVFAVAAGVVGDVAREQPDVLADKLAHLVARPLGDQQGLHQLHRTRRRVRRDTQVEQQAQAIDQLSQPCQQVGEADADAVLAGLASHAVERCIALVEQNRDVADFIHIRRRGAAVRALQQRHQHGVLGQEGRFVALQGRVGAQQLAVERRPGDAVGKHAAGFQQVAGQRVLREDVVRRTAGADFHDSNRTGQLEPEFIADGRHPEVVGRLRKYDVQDAAQVAFVPHRRQQTLAQALCQFEPEAKRRAYSGFGIERSLVR